MNEQCTNVTELGELSGSKCLEALLDVVEGSKTASIAGYIISRVGLIEHRVRSRDIVVSATTVGHQVLRLDFGSSDEPVIDYSLQIIGEEK